MRNYMIGLLCLLPLVAGAVPPENQLAAIIDAPHR